jgi:hypothetical protein
VQAFLVIANFGRQPRDLYVTMREENASDVLASRRVVVPAGERLPLPLEWAPAAGDRRKGLVFEIAPHDAMPADDVAYGKVPAGDKLPVYLAGVSPWIERALLADPLVELHPVTVTELAQSTAVDVDAFVAVAGACPESAPGGDLLIVSPPPGKCLGAVVGAAIEQPDVTSWDRADPRLRFLALDGVHVARANLLEPQSASQRLVNARQGALVADVSTATRTATLVGFDPGESDWPLKASFVLFVRNLLEQARMHRAHGVTGPARTGEPLRVSVPKSAANVRAIGPSGEDLEVALRDGLAVIPDTSHAGFYRVSWQGSQAGTTLVPANLTSAAESDLSPRSLAVDGANVSVTARGAEPDAQHERAWLVALFALVLVVFDVWYVTRGARTALRAALSWRRVLVAGTIVGALPAVGVALAWLGLLGDTYVRLARPWMALVTLASTAFVAFRLASRRTLAGPWRTRLGDFLPMAATFALSLVAAGPELGRPLDRLTILFAVDRSRSIDLVPGAETRIRRELEVAEVGMCDADRIAVIAFAAEAVTEDPPRARPAGRGAARGGGSRRYRPRGSDPPRARRGPVGLGRAHRAHHGWRGDARRDDGGRDGGGRRADPGRRPPARAAPAAGRARGGAAGALACRRG